MADKLDLFALLGNLDRKQLDVHTQLTPEEMKGFAPVVVMRWMSGSLNTRQILCLNQFVNPLVFSIPKHPVLLMQLLAICGTGRAGRFKWIKNASPVDKIPKLSLSVIKTVYNYSDRHAIQAYHIFNKADLLELGEMAGLQTDELKALKKELKDKV